MSHAQKLKYEPGSEVNNNQLLWLYIVGVACHFMGTVLFRVITRGAVEPLLAA